MSDKFTDYGIDIPPGAHGEIDTLCPECSHTRKKPREKCLSVNADDSTWFCHHCGWSGGLSVRTEWQVSRPPRKTYRRPAFYAAPTNMNPLPDKVVDWFMGRGISYATLCKERIGFENGWIKFPYYRGEEVINIKSRKLDSKEFYQEKDCEKILYGMTPVIHAAPEGETLKDSSTLIWVEGEIDRLALIEAGYEYVVSVPDGAPTPDAKSLTNSFSYLENCEGYIRQFQHHIIAVDNDKPGQRLQEELTRRLGIERCLRVEWSPGCKDADQVLMEHGVAALRDIIDHAKFFPVEGIFEISDVMPDVARLYDEGVSRGTSTGWLSLDKFLTVRPGELCVVTGIPSHGKSSWVDALMVNLAQSHGYRCGIFSPENFPLSQHFKKLAEIYIGKPFLPGTSQRMSASEVIDAGRFLQDKFYFINPSDDTLNLDAILEKAKTLVYRHGINFLVLDPYNDIDHMRHQNQSETEYISLFLRKCQRFARHYKVFFCLVAHPTKLRKDERTGQYPVPTPYDIAGSAAFRNRSDVCVSIYRPDMTQDFIEAHVQKVRFKEVGQPGMVRLDYIYASGRFMEHFGIYGQKKQRDAMRLKAREEINSVLREAREGTPDE